jgi:hypothetical protein
MLRELLKLALLLHILLFILANYMFFRTSGSEEYPLYKARLFYAVFYAPVKGHHDDIPQLQTWPAYLRMLKSTFGIYLLCPFAF